MQIKNVKLSSAISEVCKAIAEKTLCEAVLIITLKNSKQYFHSDKNLNSSDFKNDDFLKEIISHELEGQLLLKGKNLPKSLIWLGKYTSLTSLEIFPIENDQNQEQGFVVIFNSSKTKSVKTVDLLTYELYKLNIICL